MKKKLLVSFSGGETSAYMAAWLWKHKQDEYEMIFVFANTGQENEETLHFAKQCADHFGFNVVWIEAEVHFTERKSSTHRLVDYETASRDGRPFEDIIKKYGIPNMNMPHCTREMKQRPIKAYARSIGWEDYDTAIGIRVDEIDRMNDNREKNRLIYPLISMKPMTKPEINAWWKLQPFRLQLKGYQGNCKTCWKKGDQKLFQIAKESPQHFEFFKDMEKKYDQFIPEARIKKMDEQGTQALRPVRFFRKNRGVDDMLKAATEWNGSVIDDAQLITNPDVFDNVDLVGGESCEPFAECKNDDTDE